MRPFHIGLLVVGAALAGGLAVKMTQLPAFTAAAPAANPEPAPVIHPVRKVAAPAPRAVQSSPPLQDAAVSDSAPPPIIKEPEYKQSPFSESHNPAPAAAAHPKEPTVIVQKPLDVAPLAPPPVPYEAPSKPDDAATQPAPAPEYQPQAPPPRQVTLQPGMMIAVRINESLSSDKSSDGDEFTGSLAEPLVVDGLVIAERGAHVRGRVVESQKARRLSGTSQIELALSSVSTSDGQRVAISTDPWGKSGPASRVADAEKVGGGAALGAIIGAIAGGGKGAAIGAGVGGAAGAGTVAATRGKPVIVPAESIIRFRLNNRVTITERQNFAQ